MYVNNEYLINVGVGLGVHTQIHPIVSFSIFAVSSKIMRDIVDPEPSFQPMELRNSKYSTWRVSKVHIVTNNYTLCYTFAAFE